MVSTQPQGGLLGLVHTAFLVPPQGLPVWTKGSFRQTVLGSGDQEVFTQSQGGLLGLVPVEVLVLPQLLV